MEIISDAASDCTGKVVFTVNQKFGIVGIVNKRRFNENCGRVRVFEDVKPFANLDAAIDDGQRID